MEPLECLRRLAVNGRRAGGASGPAALLDRKTLALARIAALVAVGGAEPSFGAETDLAISAGATASEIVDVLVGVMPVVGAARVVAAAPNLALALGYDALDADTSH